MVSNLGQQNKMNIAKDECVTPGLISVDHTIAQILDSIDVTQPIEMIPIASALERVLASDITSPHNFPPWPAAAMDGFAFNVSDADNNKPLQLIGSALAGHPYSGTVSAGECVRITTGAPLPDGCDTVEMQENCEASDLTVVLRQPVDRGQHVRQIASSTLQGQTILESGIRLGPKELSLIASTGIAMVAVYKPLRIAVFSTGDELTSPGMPLEPGKIYDSNRLTILTMCRRMGYQVIDYGLVADDPSAIETIMLKASKEADVLLTTGGVSVGEADYIKPVIEKIGQLDIWKVAIKPGKPIAIGSIGDCRFFGLPGNPVSTIVTLNKIVRPALQKLSGQSVTFPQAFRATCTDTLRKRVGRRDYQRGFASVSESGDWLVRSTGPQGSARLDSVVMANCYIILEPDCAGIKAGETVTIELFDASLN